ncbi:nuclease-related domain-containing protein [Planococcus salinus]|uniref:DUF2075 domain-containing protein n=1 Tax=Planococcus salinus TaxID=1848460 RepID=A0A3M8P8L7_9BACL|nr:nuclease-related domain-containing protein [Planococcus salinus]RNF39600.1 DUF2075 domain-containing protein [Planococcus salinus]
MLEVHKGKSLKSYENDFFRKISRELAKVFEQRHWDGILIGMPKCVTREELQIDCLLITANQIIIIDFKDYNGTLQLPSEEEFKYGKWMLNNGVVVRGGSSPNPYSQLMKQRIKLIEEISGRMYNFDRKSVTTLVCFHNKVEVLGEVPGKLQVNFSIVDQHNYLNKIVDIIDVVENNKVNFLKGNEREIFTKTLFTAEEYQFDYHAEPMLSTPFLQVQSRNQDSIQQIQEFLLSDSRVMTLTGNTGSGKTALIPNIRELAFDLNFNDVPIFAYSNRLRRKMLKNHPELEEVESLFNTVFDFKNETIDESYKKVIPVKVHDEIHDQDKALYIIDESQLITNTNFDSDLIQFGSGHLLDDIISYIDLNSNPNRKILFIGDKNKLNYGSKTENALNLTYLKGMLENKGVLSEVKDVELKNQIGDSEIIKVCNEIAEKITKDQYNELIIKTRKNIMLCSKDDRIEALTKAYSDPQNSKILVFSNEQAQKVNHWIKMNLVKNASHIDTNDYIIFNSTIHAYEANMGNKEVSSVTNRELDFPLNVSKRVDNGFFGEVINVKHDRIIEKQILVNNEKVTLRFIPCHIKLQDETLIETLVFENYLNMSKNELSKNEIIAYQMVLKKYEDEVLGEEPFERSPEYREMMDHPSEYTVVNKNEKELYRDQKNKNKLTRFEKAYKRRVLEKLKVPTSEYFKILNACRVKYGWAMTVNKAMAYSFETVFFITSQEENRGRTNREYFKWIYTGISSGLSNVYLINWKPISPFLKTEFRETASVKKSNKRNAILTLSNSGTASLEIKSFLENKLAKIATISTIATRNYLEIVTLEMKGRSIELFFDYNGKGEVKTPRLKLGDEKDYTTVLGLLSPAAKDFVNETETIKSFLIRFNEILEGHHVQMKILDQQEWNMLVSFTNEVSNVDIHFWYNSVGMISTFSYADGSKEFFQEIVGLIKEIYIVE